MNEDTTSVGHETYTCGGCAEPIEECDRTGEHLGRDAIDLVAMEAVVVCIPCAESEHMSEWIQVIPERYIAQDVVKAYRLPWVSVGETVQLEYHEGDY